MDVPKPARLVVCDFAQHQVSHLGPHVNDGKTRFKTSPSRFAVVAADRAASVPACVIRWFWYRMLSNSLPKSVSSCLFRSLTSASSRPGESPKWHHGEIRVSFSRLHLESTDTRNLRVLRGVVKTERVVDGGGDVLNFRAELKIVDRTCPLTARVRLGIALAGFVADKTAGQKIHTGREHAISIATFHWTTVDTRVRGWCIDASQTRNATRHENELVQLFKQNVEMRIQTDHFSKARTTEARFFASHVTGLVSK